MKHLAASTRSVAPLALMLAALPLALSLPVQIDLGLQLLALPGILCAWLTRRDRASTFGHIDALLVGLWGVSMIATLTMSPHAARSAVSTAALTLALATAGLAGSLARDANAKRILLAAMAGGAALGAVMVVIHGGSTPALYTHPRIFGLHMLAGAVSALGWLLAAEGRERAVAGLVAALTWTGLGWSGSRAPVLGLGIALVVGLLVYRPAERRRLLLHASWLGVVSLGASWAIGNGQVNGWWTALQRTASAGTDLGALSSTRTEFWQVVWSEILRAPLLGHGGDHYFFLRPRQVGNQPHNFILQWLLEYGFAGTIPLLALLARRLVLSLKASACDDVTSEARAAAALLAGGTACALFDGVFHHAVIALPMAVAAGLAVPSRSDRNQSPRVFATTWRIWVCAACLALIMHNGLSKALTSPRPPDSPDSPAPIVLRHFPSETFGLWSWLNHWQTTSPEVSLDWARWAQKHSTDPAWFHLYAAQYLWRRGDFEGARAEVEAGLTVVGSQIEFSELNRMRAALDITTHADH